MVSENPVGACWNWTSTIGIRSAGVVPDGASSGNDELGWSDNEIHDPKVSEQGVQEDILGLITPLDSRQKWNVFSGLNISNWTNVQGNDDPNSEPNYE